MSTIRLASVTVTQFKDGFKEDVGVRKLISFKMHPVASISKA